MGNLMETGTKISDYLDKIDSCLNSMANEIALAIKDKKGYQPSEIKKLVKDLPLEYQNEVLLRVISALNKSSSNDKVKKSKTDYFGSRGF